MSDISLAFFGASVRTGGLTVSSGVAFTGAEDPAVEGLLAAHDAMVKRDRAEHKARMAQVADMQANTARRETTARRVGRLQEKAAAYQAALDKLLQGNGETVLMAAAKGSGGVAVSLSADRLSGM